MKFVYSTRSNDIIFPIYIAQKDGSKISRIQREILITGKANIAHRKTLIVPKGVVTKIEDNEYDVLKEMRGFKDQVERGYLSVETVEEKPDRVASSMKKKDKSAPITKADLAETGIKESNG